MQNNIPTLYILELGSSVVSISSVCTRYSQFFKKNLKVICALAGILIPASV